MAECIPKGSGMPQYIRALLGFLAMSEEEHAARTQQGEGEGGGPSLTSPLIVFDIHSQTVRWVGAAEASTDAALQSADAAHYSYFRSRHGGVAGASATMGFNMRQQKATLTLPPGSAAQLATFQAQERDRFAHPTLAFTYTLRDGAARAVAPLVRAGAKALGKARDHFLLVDERPPAATIVALVRDAAARLPSRDGECAGSRADVCELLKESGYIVRGVNDAQISQVVSGALDRLHQENDPCVRYDLERKLWIYLHGSRTEDELNKPPPSRFEPVLARQ